MVSLVLVVGTRKGLFLLRDAGAREEWRLEGPFLPGSDITYATLDQRSGKLFATHNDPWFGSRVAVSLDLGATWQEEDSTPRFSQDSGLAVERIWRIEPGRQSEPNKLYCGVDPANFFSSVVLVGR